MWEGRGRGWETRGRIWDVKCVGREDGGFGDEM